MVLNKLETKKCPIIVVVGGGCYFFTVVLANRRYSLLTDHIEQLRQSFREVMKAHPFKIDTAVVLPNHLHCILTLPTMIIIRGDG